MKANEITTVAVIGAGTMGAGIAGVFARAGCAVRLVDMSDALLDRGMTILRAAQQGLVKAKQITRRDAAASLKRVTLLTDLAKACDGVPLLVETVPEKLALKRKMFSQFDELCPKRAILATNTSGLSVTKIAQATRRASRVAGFHFWNPPHIMRLVEVTKGKETSNAAAATLVAVARKIGKHPILVRHDIPGFVGNRLQFAVMREALHLLSEGIASAEDIDTAMTNGPGLRWGIMGPLRIADLGGLDVFHAISEYLFAELNSNSSVPAVFDKLVKKGKLGAKSGAGFYRYRGKMQDDMIHRRDRVLLGFQKVLDEL